MLVRPSECSLSFAASDASPRRRATSRIGVPLRALVMSAYRRYCFSDPAAPFLRPCGISRSDPDGNTVKCPIHRSRRVRPPSEVLRPKPSRCAAALHGSSHGLFVPTAHQAAKVHDSRALPARYGPPSGFGYPLDGLRPSRPCRLYFVPAALLGFTLRSFLHSSGDVAFPRTSRPHAVRLQIDTTAEAVIESRSAAASGFLPWRASLATRTKD
jgi:hypothetical protein